MKCTYFDHLAQTLSAALLLAAPVAAQKKPDPRLDEARSKLVSPSEATARDAGRLCVEMNNVDAVSLLLEQLDLTDSRGGLPPPHWRDIAWESLILIKDPYARQRVVKELANGKTSAWMREWCAELLGLYGDADLAQELVKSLSDKEGAVQRAAARSLGMLKFRPAIGALSTAAKSKDVYLRSNAIEALARIDPEHQREAFLAALQDKDGAERCALLGALAEIYPDLAEERSAAALSDKDWRPQLRAVDNLGRIRTKTAIDALVPATAAGRPVVAERAVDALQKHTGMRFTKPEQWKLWWTENRESFHFADGAAPAAGEAQRTRAEYNGIRVVSDHVAFLIDTSSRMSESLRSRSISRSEAALAELTQVLDKLVGELTFSLFTYSEAVHPFSEEPEPLTAKTKKRALEFVSKTNNLGSKDIWQALETVLAIPEIDTVYLLSSGEPDIGKYVHFNRVTAHLKDLNRFHGLVVHTIAYNENEGYRHQLEEIAKATGGEFKWFD
jgi:HEAT repeat protein